MCFLPGWIYNLFLGSDYCSSLQSCAAAQEAGLYDPQNSTSAYLNVSNGPGLVYKMGSEAARQEAGSASILLDSIRLNTTGDPIIIVNSSIDVIHDDTITFPDGSTYSPSVGFLSLGSITPTREYSSGHGQIAPNYLYAQGITPSASMGLHYGSATLGPGGSLVWGGYDQSRVIGRVETFEFYHTEDKTTSYFQPNLIDVEVGVETGTSPFPPEPTTGLLQVNNSLGPWQPAIINPVLSFLYMTPETCSNIARLLPVTLLQQKGIYLWNTTDPQYERIVNSPAYLAFTFLPSASSSNLTVKVPFKLLNLTLESPILSSPRQYFPCSPYNVTKQTVGIFLGRAFLQSAFLGANLNQSAFFLAQGPGPDADAPNIQPIPIEKTTIGSLPSENFAKSWANHWTPLSDNRTSQTPAQISNTSKPSSTAAVDANKTLSTGAIVGVAIGTIIVVWLLLSGIVLFVIRWRKRREKPHDGQLQISSPLPPTGNDLHEKDTDLRMFEVRVGVLAHEAPAHGIYEVEEQKRLPELPTDDAQAHLLCHVSF